VFDVISLAGVEKVDKLFMPVFVVAKVDNINKYMRDWKSKLLRRLLKPSRAKISKPLLVLTGARKRPS